MKLSEFKRRLKSRQIPIISFLNDEKIRLLEDLVALRSMLQYVDFKCDFDLKGVCSHQRTTTPYFRTKKCCCESCAIRVGYLDFIPDNMVDFYAKAFSKDTGFWIKDKGCCLENFSSRSITCLSYNCSHDEFRGAMRKYAYIIRKIENEIKDLHRKEGKTLHVESVVKAITGQQRVWPLNYDKDLHEKNNLLGSKTVAKGTVDPIDTGHS